MAMDSSIVYSDILKIALPWRDFRITLPHSGSSVSKGKMAPRSVGNLVNSGFFVAYLMLAGTIRLIFFAQKVW
jgi:hypothetical protein